MIAHLSIRLVVLVLALLVWASPAQAAYVLIANVKGQANDTFTTASVNTAGATLLIMVTHTDHGTITPSDSNGNTWLVAIQNTSFKFTTTYFSYYKGTIGTPIDVGAGHTFTLTGTDHFGTMQVYAFSGALTASTPLDVFDQDLNFGGTTCLPGSVLPSTSDQLLVSADTHNSAQVETINGGFTSPAGAGTGYGNPNIESQALGGHSAYLIQTTAATANVTWTNSAGVNHTCTIASFKAGAGGSPPGCSGRQLLLGVGCE